MAGRARTNGILDALWRRTIDHFKLDPAEKHDDDETPLDYVQEWLASGRYLSVLAEEISNETGIEVWATTLERALARTYGGAVLPALRAARARASHQLAEESVAIIDAADDSSGPAVSKAAHRARSRQWMAEKYDPETFGQKQGASVTINLDSLYLAAISREPNKVTSADTMKALPSSDAVVLPRNDHE